MALLIHCSQTCKTGFHQHDSFSSSESIKAEENIVSLRFDTKNRLQADDTKTIDPPHLISLDNDKMEEYCR